MKVKTIKRAKAADLDILETYGSVDFFQMKKAFPMLVMRLKELEGRLKALQKAQAAGKRHV